MPPLATHRSLHAALLPGLATLFGLSLLLPAGAIWLHRGTGVALWLALAALALFVTGAAVLLRRTVLEPLRTVSDAAEAIAAGDRSRRMPRVPVRELNDVSAAFALLSHRLAEEQARLARGERRAGLGRLSSRIAEELQGPLAAIRDHANAIRRRVHARSASTGELEVLAALDRECDRVGEILRGLRDCSRSRPATLAAVDLEQVVCRTVDALRVKKLFAEVEVGLELTNVPLVVSADARELERVFESLLANAVEAMHGHGRIVVRLERVARFTLREPATRRADAETGNLIEHPPASRAQRWLEGNDAAEIAKVIVADAGPGVAPELADAIFDPFYTTKPAATGLGLAIAARIIEDFGGTIWVTAAREGGASFHILLPALPAPVSRRWLRLRRRIPTPSAVRSQSSKR